MIAGLTPAAATKKPFTTYCLAKVDYKHIAIRGESGLINAKRFDKVKI